MSGDTAGESPVGDGEAMNDIPSLIGEGGGLVHKRDLVARGARDRDLTWAVRHGLVRRPRRGWYTTFAPSDPRYIAVRAGGRLTGASALALIDAWQWESSPAITVSVPRNASRLRRVKGVRLVWDDLELRERGSNFSVEPRDALLEALLEVPFEEAVALLDWAVDRRIIDGDEIPRFVAGLPVDMGGIDAWVERSGESFLESVTRTRLLARGHSVVSQEGLWNGQRIDFVVDGVLGIEVDGRTYHASTFESDRRKDLEIVISGRAILRLSYSMIRNDWSRVVAAIDAAVSNHRLGRGPRADNSGSWPRPPRRGTRLWRLRSPRRSLQPELPAEQLLAGPRRRGRHRRLGTIFG